MFAIKIGLWCANVFTLSIRHIVILLFLRDLIKSFDTVHILQHAYQFMILILATRRSILRCVYAFWSFSFLYVLFALTILIISLLRLFCLIGRGALTWYLWHINRFSHVRRRYLVVSCVSRLNIDYISYFLDFNWFSVRSVIFITRIL